MLWFKIKISFLFLTILTVQADHLMEDAHFELSTPTSMTALPIVFQLSTTISSDDLKPTSMIIKRNSEENLIMLKHIDNHLNVNDVEVFDDKVGPQMAKQEEEEAEVEPEAAPEDETAPEENEAKDEETEPPANDEPEPEETEKEEIPVEAEESKPEIPIEIATEEKDEAALETENETANEEPAPEVETENQPIAEEEVTTGNVDSEMLNDEPSKDDGKHAGETTTVIAIENNKNEISCFTCTSNDDLKCHKSPTHQTPCPKGNESNKEKQHGCYTLYESDTNITMRGCVDELAEEGLKYCLTNEKFCELCYKTGCNNKTAPNLGNMQQFNISSLLITIMALMAVKKLI